MGKVFLISLVAFLATDVTAQARPKYWYLWLNGHITVHASQTQCERARTAELKLWKDLKLAAINPFPLTANNTRCIEHLPYGWELIETPTLRKKKH